jgi:hypothetical protein
MPISCRATGRTELRFELAAKILGPGTRTRDVVADVQHQRRSGRRREHSVECGDAVRIGRWNLKPLTRIVERAAADPPDVRVDGMQYGQKQVAARAGFSPRPRAVRDSDYTIDGVAFGLRRSRRGEMQIHG